MGHLVAATIVAAVAAPATCTQQQASSSAQSTAVQGDFHCGAGTVLSGNQCVIPATCGAGTALVGTECLPADEAPDPLIGGWVGPQHNDNYGSGYYQNWWPVCDFFPTHAMTGNRCIAGLPPAASWQRIGQDRYVFGGTMWVQATFAADGKSVHLIVEQTDSSQPTGHSQLALDFVRAEVLATP